MIRNTIPSSLKGNVHIIHHRIRTKTFIKRKEYWENIRDCLMQEIEFKTRELRNVQKKILAFENAIEDRRA